MSHVTHQKFILKYKQNKKIAYHKIINVCFSIILFGIGYAVENMVYADTHCSSAVVCHRGFSAFQFLVNAPSHKSNWNFTIKRDQDDTQSQLWVDGVLCNPTCSKSDIIPIHPPERLPDTSAITLTFSGTHAFTFEANFAFGHCWNGLVPSGTLSFRVIPANTALGKYHIENITQYAIPNIATGQQSCIDKSVAKVIQNVILACNDGGGVCG